MPERFASIKRQKPPWVIETDGVKIMKDCRKGAAIWSYDAIRRQFTSPAGAAGTRPTTHNCVPIATIYSLQLREEEEDVHACAWEEGAVSCAGAVARVCRRGVNCKQHPGQLW